MRHLFSLFLPFLMCGGFSFAEQGGVPSGEHHVLVTVGMEGEGFMCPFLTPQFIDLLQTRSHWVYPQPIDSRIQYAQPLEEAWSQGEVTSILKDIGYPEDGAVYLQWDTVTVLPPKPEP